MEPDASSITLAAKLLGNKNTEFRSFMILLFFLLSNEAIYSQSKFEFSAGVSIPGAINIKLNYGKDLQFGTSLGFLPLNDEFDIPIEIEASYHFLGKSLYVEQPPWYILGGGQLVNIVLSEKNHFDYLMGLFLRFGRSFNFSQKVGINFDLGAMFPLNQPVNPPSNVWPSGSIRFFIRL